VSVQVLKLMHGRKCKVRYQLLQILHTLPVMGKCVQSLNPFRKVRDNLKNLGGEYGGQKAIVTLDVSFDRNVKHKDLSRIVQNVCKVIMTAITLFNC